MAPTRNGGSRGLRPSGRGAAYDTGLRAEEKRGEAARSDLGYRDGAADGGGRWLGLGFVFLFFFCLSIASRVLIVWTLENDFFVDRVGCFRTRKICIFVV
ncbi:uncharacterized protein M6B38_380045 [Iris pallida]|uniref:Uncharacterized protein n=1 Tax=Iris pallida TaxID=29817 RepID=A0AAX6G8H0_IRIPA|nr:uncharacterized protein M6B38_380045 [Iris pallida]